MTDMFIKTEYQLNTFSVVIFPFNFFQYNLICEIHNFLQSLRQ